ncbi:hypothetical protein BH11PSE11_BH11PSE11_19040 [soil metagenome]
MKKLILFLALVLGAGLMSLSTATFAAERASAEEAQKFVKNAVAYLKKHGAQKAFADFADTGNAQFHDRDLYLFVYDFNGYNVAHGNNPKMVGKDLLELRDVNGKPIIRGFIEAVKDNESGWVEYMWPNPITKVIEYKSGYVERVGDLIVGTGIYKPVKK